MNSINYLPNDIMSHILSIRTEEMKKEKEIKDNKNKYDLVVSTFKEKLYFLKDDILRDHIGYKKLYNEVMNDGKCKWEDCKKILDTWELWEINIYFNILTPIGEEYEDEERCNNLNYY